MRSLFIILVLAFLCQVARAQITPIVIINIAKDVWNVIEANQPVANDTVDYASAMPEGVTSSIELAGWKIPVEYKFNSTWTNDIWNIITFSWHVEFTYGGSYNGTGQYLADVTILPGELNVEIPYQFYVTTHVGTPLNVGTNANPIAALQLDLNYAVSSPIDKDQGSFSYFVQGDGGFKVISESRTVTKF